MIHPHTEIRFIHEDTGYGVVATRPIPRGTITWVQDKLDREFTPADLEQFDAAHREILDRYSYRNALGHYVFCWDHARFMNHSFHPTCLLTPYGLEIAVRDIAAGQEITNDYGCFNIIEPFTPIDEGHARKDVLPCDLARLSGLWDAMIAEALRDLPHLDQPLSHLLSPGVWEELHAAAHSLVPPRSVASLHFQGA